MSLDAWKIFATFWLCLGISKFVAAGPMNKKEYSWHEYLIGLPLCLLLGPVWIITDLAKGEDP